MRAVTNGRRVGAFALAPAHGHRRGGDELHRLKSRAFMRAIAKRRMRRAAARAPKMHAGLDFEDQRFVITGDRPFRHVSLLADFRHRLGLLFLHRKQRLGRILRRVIGGRDRHRPTPESGIEFRRNATEVSDRQPGSEESSGCTNEERGFHAGGKEARKPLGTRGL